MSFRKSSSIVSLILMMIVIYASGCTSGKSPKSTQVVIPKLHNGDAKFFGDRVMTGVNSTLTRISMDGKIEQTYDGVIANWIDGLDEKNILVYGNFSNEVGIVRFNDDYSIADSFPILHGDNLLIDPTISFFDGTYYLTVTEIVGTVNNADIFGINGEYTLHMYTSSDLRDWKHISVIASGRNNIEDVDIGFFDGKIYAVYEKEECDKGKSAVVLKQSADYGKTWGDEIILLKNIADQEPAVFDKTKNGWILYYSSDIASPGKTYMGSRAYYTVFDSSFKETDHGLLNPNETVKGVLLYDVKKDGGKTYLLYAGNYLTDCDLVIDQI